MLIKLKDLATKYGFVPKGVIHLGAHELEEINDYMELGVQRIVWVEGNPDLIQRGQEKINGTGQILLQALIYDEDETEVNFYVTNNMQSSSILNFGKHKDYHPTVEVQEIKKLKTKRVDSLFKENMIKIEDFDFVNLDIQGVELRALKSFGPELKNINFIYTEVNSGHVYENNDLIHDLDSFLSEMGFQRVETSMTEFEWGDAFYIRR